MNAVRCIQLVSILSVLVPVFFIILKFKKLPVENKIIGIFIFVSAISDFIAFILASNGYRTALLFNLYYFMCFVILSSYYHKVVFRFKNKVYLYCGIGAYVASLIIVIHLQSLDSYHGPLWAVGSAVVVMFGIVYNNYQVEKPPLFDSNLYSGLIFNAAIMLYFSFNFFLFIIADYVLTEFSTETSRLTWSFHNVNNIIKNIALAAGMYYTGRRRINLTAEEVARIQWMRIE